MPKVKKMSFKEFANFTEKALEGAKKRKYKKVDNLMLVQVYAMLIVHSRTHELYQSCFLNFIKRDSPHTTLQISLLLKGKSEIAGLKRMLSKHYPDSRGMLNLYFRRRYTQ